MLSLHTNASGLNTQNSLASVNKTLAKSMTNLGTGFRVNTAMDDAAGLQIATRLNAQSRGMQVAQKNTQNGISMIQTAEGALSEVNNMLLRMKDLASESANGTSSDADKAAMQAEYDALGLEMNNILSNTSFAGSKLFAEDKAIGGALGKRTGITFQVGATSSETVSFKPGAANGSLAGLLTKLTQISSKIDIAPTAAEEVTDANKAAVNLGMLEASKDLDTVTIADVSDFNGDQAAFDATITALKAEKSTEVLADYGTAFDTAVGATVGKKLDDIAFADLSAANKATLGADATEQAANFDAIQAARLEAQAAKALEEFTAKVAGGVAPDNVVEADLTTAAGALSAGGLTSLFGDVKTAYAKQVADQEKLTAQQAVDANKVGEISGDNANATIDVLTQAIAAVGTLRSDMGAVANRLEHTFNNLGNMVTNTEIAKGRILDVDFAKESSNMVKNQMLMQTSTAMLKQSNSLSQMVGSLVQ